MQNPSLDLRLHELIERSLTRDERLSAQRIDVAVHNGRVTLTGSVQSHRRKLAAAEIAASFEGCRHVENNLVVQPTIVPDPDLADSVRGSLDSCADLTKETITVAARNGVVTLTGHVTSPWERTIAQDSALGVRGVRKVQNQIIVDAAAQDRDQALAEELGEMLRQTRGLSETDIQVSINSAAIVLSGNVPSLWQKEMAESVAARFIPWMLRNEITVDD